MTLEVTFQNAISDADITWEMMQQIKFVDKPITHSLIFFGDPKLEELSVNSFKCKDFSFNFVMNTENGRSFHQHYFTSKNELSKKNLKENLRYHEVHGR